MCSGDRVDDGEAESDAIIEAAWVGVESLEGLEESLEVDGWDERAGVGDRENSVSCFGAGCD